MAEFQLLEESNKKSVFGKVIGYIQNFVNQVKLLGDVN